MKTILMPLVAAVVGIMLGMTAQATPFDLSQNGPGTLGSSETFILGALSFTASGEYSTLNPIYGSSTITVGGSYNPTAYSANNLYYKTGGGGETGIGLANPSVSSQGEIPSYGAVILNLTGLGGALNGAQLSFGSAQSSEDPLVFGINADGTWTLLADLTGNANSEAFYTLTGNYSQIAISEAPNTTSTSGANVLLTGLSVPDGGATVAMLGLTSVCGLLMVRRMKVA